MTEGNICNCVNCNEKFDCQTDLQICESCMNLFDLDEVWRLHDLNKLDALDFNESKKFR